MRAILSLDPAQRALIRVATHEMEHVSPEARAEFGRLYQEKFLGPVGRIFEEGVASGELRPVDPPLTTRVLLGMLYPFLSASEREPESRDEVPGRLEQILFDGLSSGH